MKSDTTRLAVALIVGALAVQAPTMAQQQAPPPGSPAGTTTIDGKQLPAPPGKFGGQIQRSARDSKPYWQPRIVPPKGAPNVLLIITDDAGYGSPARSGG